jgi:hypothetical protein
MFPEFVPDKLMWAMAVAATVAVMVSRAPADAPAHSVHGGATLYAAAAFAPAHGGAPRPSAP